MADPALAFAYLMADEDSKEHPGEVTPEPRGARARLGINSLAHPEVTPTFWTCSYAEAVPIAREIFERCYWNVMKLGLVQNQDVANKMADLGFNMNSPALVGIVQRTVAVPVDLRMGTLTLAAINAKRPEELLPKIAMGALDHYIDIVVAHPADYLKYLKTWAHRAMR